MSPSMILTNKTSTIKTAESEKIKTKKGLFKS